MKRSGPPKRKTPLKRSPIKQWRAKEGYLAAERRDDPNDPETVFREDVRRRSRGWCELCLKKNAVQIHHRRSREVRWSKWLPENGFDVCYRCHHNVIHANPEWAMRHGLILRKASRSHPAPVVGCPLDCSVDHIA